MFFFERRKIWLLFWFMLKKNRYSLKITDATYFEVIKWKCVNIDGNVESLHRIHVNREKRINLCITNKFNHIEVVIC